MRGETMTQCVAARPAVQTNLFHSPFHHALQVNLVQVITDNLRPIEIGVTNRIRTGTNAFTGRDAAVTS